MKFHQTESFKNLNNYKDMRVNFELLLIFKLIKHFKLNKILEIGFWQGKSFGTMIEATNAVGDLTAVDIVMDQTLYNKIYHGNPIISNKTINLLTMSSADFVDLPASYDFINIDGDHTMPQVLDDIIMASKLIKQNGIIMIDDYILPDVDLAIDKFLKLNTDFVPFLIDQQAVFFHHISHNAVDFLDIELENIFSSFALLNNVTYKSCIVKKIECLPAITNNDDIFSLICQRYDL
jgi:hypothetical protein